jgi:hypothetical protein
MQQSIVKFYYIVVQTLLNMFRGIIMPIFRNPSNCRCSLWFPYECGGGRVLSRSRSTSTFIRKAEAATAV